MLNLADTYSSEMPYATSSYDIHKASSSAATKVRLICFDASELHELS